MPIKETRTYTTDDGVSHETHAAALEHERIRHLVRFCQEHLEVGQGTAGIMARQLLDHRDDLLRALDGKEPEVKRIEPKFDSKKLLQCGCHGMCSC